MRLVTIVLIQFYSLYTRVSAVGASTNKPRQDVIPGAGFNSNYFLHAADLDPSPEHPWDSLGWKWLELI